MTEALKIVRERYYKDKNKFKSANKMKLGGGEAETNRVATARLEILRARWRAHHDPDTDPIGALMEGKAYNCGDLAQIAAYTLQEDLGMPARIAEFEMHQVALIGAGAGDLPANMKDWNPGIYICDPWCNIACRAKDYPDQFLAKMKKWQNPKEGEGKLIKMNEERGFISPMDEEWVSKMLNGEKKVL